MASKIITALCIGFLFLSGALHAAPPLNISWQTVDNPNGIETVFNGISGDKIVGYYFTDEGGFSVAHSFVYDGVNYSPVDNPGQFQGGTFRTVANGISGNKIVGNFGDTGNHGFIFDGTTWTTLDAPNAAQNMGGTEVSGISGNKVIGTYHDAAGRMHGFVYDGSTYNVLTPPIANTAANVLGISGDKIVGDYNRPGGGVPSFLYDGFGNWSSINNPSTAPNNTIASGIDGSNIVGYYESTTGYHSFLFDGSTWTPLDDPLADQHNGGGTVVNGISGNQAVGYYISSTGVHAFIATIPEPPTIVLTLLCWPIAYVLRRRQVRRPA